VTSLRQPDAVGEAFNEVHDDAPGVDTELDRRHLSAIDEGGFGPIARQAGTWSAARRSMSPMAVPSYS
jgi:hypothetical protein